MSTSQVSFYTNRVRKFKKMKPNRGTDKIQTIPGTGKLTLTWCTSIPAHPRVVKLFSSTVQYNLACMYSSTYYHANYVLRMYVPTVYPWRTVVYSVNSSEDSPLRVVRGFLQLSQSKLHPGFLIYNRNNPLTTLWRPEQWRCGFGTTHPGLFNNNTVIIINGIQTNCKSLLHPASTLASLARATGTRGTLHQ